MKKFITVLLIAFFTSSFAFSQDFIVKTNDDVIPCKIRSIDSLSIRYSVKTDSSEVTYDIDKSLVRELEFGERNYIIDTLPPDSKQAVSAMLYFDYNHNINSNTIRGKIVNSIGLNYDFIIKNKLGLQVSLGYLIYGMGINYYFQSHVQGSFLSLQYWGQGFGKKHYLSLIAPHYVYRGKKWFTAQIGLGFPIIQGVAFPTTEKFPSLIPMIGIGGYLAR